ncbi:MAG: carbamoyltransferase HypF [Acidobacteriota bacterium]
MLVASMSVEGRRVEIRGIVQGVGFRPWVFRLARAHDLGGWVRNDAGGVTIEAFGPVDALEAFLHELGAAPPPAAVIRSLESHRIAGRSTTAFEIVASAAAPDRRVSIPADLPTCSNCLAEVLDPADRRYRYPFTNCTNCGPRFTVARDVPYDRPATTMAAFEMCSACRQEYESPEDRRFHAQPNACPICGPRLWLRDRGGQPISGDPIKEAARLLRQGLIVAVKGLGGFHLACDATSGTAVVELRRRKRRDAKPFAIMAATPEEAERLGDISRTERALLESAERPIVIVDRRPESGLAANVAPHNPTVGLMLPYTPLHHLLLHDTGLPLVMTSGNLGEEPLAYRNDEALARLAGIADAFLLHDREIETRCDDSVARVIASRPTVFRRSRGYVPRAIPIARAFREPVLACGAMLKNTFCIGTGETAYLGPHVGDLENLETYESFEHAVERLQRFVGVRPQILVHDLHPEYLSTRYARSRDDVRLIPVQHHHAHVASVMAEHGLDGPVLGIAYDGTGLGPDGAAWGGEFLLVDRAGFRRLATCRPLVLAGGDTAIRQVWRQALALLTDAFDGNPPTAGLALFQRVPDSHIHVVRQMMAAGVNCPRAHGVGRYFDAVGSIGLARPVSRYEGHVALEWNLAAAPNDHGSYPFALSPGPAVLEIDLRAAVRAIVSDLRAGEHPAVVSARFHSTLVDATVAVVHQILAQHGPMPVALSGGCFQNRRLTEGILARVGDGVRVVRHEQVPPGDGGLALGQAFAANGLLESPELAGTAPTGTHPL